jgi:schlafen family protein
MLSYERILEIIECETWNDLLGEIEGDFLDCKREIYDLSVEPKKIELAKDVTSFANAGCGVIIVGIATQTSAVHFSDEITELRPFESRLFNHSQYHEILAAWTYPKLENVRIEWKPESSGATRGFGLIIIPPQSEERKPFLITKTILDTGRRSEILLGYAERRRDVSEPAKIQELHQTFRDGLGYSRQISQRFDAIEAILVSGNRPQRNSIDITPRMEKAFAAAGLNQRSHFALAAYPDSPTMLPNVFSARPDSIAEKLTNPPALRSAGFGIRTLDTPRIIEGEFWRMRTDQRKVIDLYQDGTLIFGCAADAGFLNWATKSPSRINTIVLIEVTHSFCLFYGEVLRDLSPQPENVHFRFQFGNTHPTGDCTPLFLVPYAMGTLGAAFDDNAHSTPTDTGCKDIVIRTPEFTPGAAAYKIIEKIYLWFGFTSEFIPYTEEIDGRKVISESAIRAL